MNQSVWQKISSNPFMMLSMSEILYLHANHTETDINGIFEKLELTQNIDIQSLS